VAVVVTDGIDKAPPPVHRYSERVRLRMPRVSCTKCAKKSGWLLAIPAFVLMPKCPLCLLAYITFAGAAAWSHSLVVASAALGIVWAVWKVVGAFAPECYQRKENLVGRPILAADGFPARPQPVSGSCN
jgi:hypothetical protein